MAMLVRFITLGLVRVVVVMVVVTMRVGSIGGASIGGGSIVSSGGFVIYIIIGTLVTLCGDGSRLLPHLLHTVTCVAAMLPIPPRHTRLVWMRNSSAMSGMPSARRFARARAMPSGRAKRRGLLKGTCRQQHPRRDRRAAGGVGFVEGHRVASCWGRGGGAWGGGWAWWAALIIVTFFPAFGPVFLNFSLVGHGIFRAFTTDVLNATD